MGGCENGNELNLRNIQFKDVLRFVKKIEYSQTDDGCDIWTAGTFDIYGSFRWDGKNVAAHRFAYALYIGPIPAGFLVRHKVCDNPLCVRANHLLLGNSLDNKRDCMEKKRHAYGIRSPHAKLNPEIIMEAARLFRDNGFTTRELAKKFNVGPTVLKYALSGKQWSHVIIPDFDYKEISQQHCTQAHIKNAKNMNQVRRKRKLDSSINPTN